MILCACLLPTDRRARRIGMQIGVSWDRSKVCRASERLASAVAAPSRGAKRNKACPDHDGDIGNVEHTRPKLPNADVEEVHDLPLGTRSIQFECAARNEQDEANTGGASEPTSDRRGYEDQQRKSSGNREDRGSRRTGPIRPKAQETAGVLRVAQSNGVRQV
jgi:hypothetical protein